MENISDNSKGLKDEDKIPNFEIDSIELAGPQLFSGDKEINSESYENKDEKEPDIFEKKDFQGNVEVKQPEMFEISDTEDDLEIPAFLRRQKN